MRRAATVALGLSLLLCGTAGAADGDAVDRAVKALDDPAWAVRRAAAKQLETEGLEALDALTRGEGTPSPEARARLERWTVALEKGRHDGALTVAAAAERVLRRVEGLADDAQVRLVPGLLRARLERRLTQIVTRPGERSRTASDGFAAREAVAGLRPEADAILVDLVLRARDLRVVAGALAVLSGDGAGLLPATAEEALVRREREDPASVAALAEFSAPDGTSCALPAGLALAASGRLAAAGRLVLGRPDDLVRAIGERLVRRGDADLAQETFLTSALAGEATASDATEAVRRALAAGQPWLARMLGRRAVFLAPGDAAARKALVDADVAAGLLATARADRGGAEAGPEPAGEDAAEARTLDEALRAGSLGARVAWRVEVEGTPLPGLVPVAAAAGVVAYGRSDGRVVVADPASGLPRVTGRSGASGLPRAVAVTGPLVGVVSAAGSFAAWRLQGDDLVPVADARGPFTGLSARGGGFVLVTSAGEVMSAEAGRSPRLAAKPPPFPHGTARRVHVVGEGEALVVGDDWAARVVLATGTWQAVEGAGTGPLAPYGAKGLLLAEGAEWRLLAADGSVAAKGHATDDAEIVGLAGDEAAHAVYVCTLSDVAACSAEDGTTMWHEPIEASGPASVGGGLVLVPAGSGPDPAGDGRVDRTVTALRASGTGASVFSKEAVGRVVAAARQALGEGRVGVAALLVDPLLAWLDEEHDAIVAEIHAARAAARAAGGEAPGR